MFRTFQVNPAVVMQTSQILPTEIVYIRKIFFFVFFCFIHQTVIDEEIYHFTIIQCAGYPQ